MDYYQLQEALEVAIEYIEELLGNSDREESETLTYLKKILAKNSK